MLVDLKGYNGWRFWYTTHAFDTSLARANNVHSRKASHPEFIAAGPANRLLRRDLLLTLKIWPICNGMKCIDTVSIPLG